MAITNPAAIRFVNEHVRPLCEEIRALAAKLDASRALYDAGIGNNFYGHEGEAIEDGRDAEGVSRLNGSHVTAFTALVLYDLKAVLDGVGAAATIAVPCVRPLEAH